MLHFILRDIGTVNTDPRAFPLMRHARNVEVVLALVVNDFKSMVLSTELNIFSFIGTFLHIFIKQRKFLEISLQKLL